MTDLLVGVDVGTSRLKVGVFDLSGDLVAFAEGECAPSYLPDHRVEADAQQWWAAFSSSFESCLRQVDRESLRAIGVSSQANTYVLLDVSGKPLGPAVSWLDARGDAAGAARDLAGHDFYRHVGWPRPIPGHALCKLRLHAENPNAWADARHIVFAEGYVIFRLTGNAVVSRNLAAMSGLYSMVMDDWWPEAVGAARVPRALLPAICDMGQAAGELDAALAQRWRIPQIPVVAGANDQTAAALGAGLHEPARMTLGLGTAWAAYQVIPADAPAASTRPLRGPYPGGLHYQLQYFDTGGAVLEWVKKTFMPDRDWPAFFGQALSAVPGCEGLRVVPGYTPDHEPEQGATLSGLELRHERQHVVRAFLEGLACVVRELLDELSAEGIVRVSGGGSADEAWVQMLADMTGRTLERLGQPQAGLWGTALMAGHGAGLFDDMLKVAHTTSRGGRQFAPHSELRGVYDRVYTDYLHLKEAHAHDE